MAFTKWEIGECCSGGVNCSGCNIPDGTDLTFTCGATVTTLHFFPAGWITDPCVPIAGTTNRWFFASMTCAGPSAGMDVFVYGDSGCLSQVCLSVMPTADSVSCTPLVITFRIPALVCAEFYGPGVDNIVSVTL